MMTSSEKPCDPSGISVVRSPIAVRSRTSRSSSSIPAYSCLTSSNWMKPPPPTGPASTVKPSPSGGLKRKLGVRPPNEPDAAGSSTIFSPTFVTDAATGPISADASIAPLIITLPCSSPAPRVRMTSSIGPSARLSGIAISIRGLPSNANPCCHDHTSAPSSSASTLTPCASCAMKLSPSPKSTCRCSLTIPSRSLASVNVVPAVINSTEKLAPSIDTPIASGLPSSVTGAGGDHTTPPVTSVVIAVPSSHSVTAPGHDDPDRTAAVGRPGELQRKRLRERDLGAERRRRVGRDEQADRRRGAGRGGDRKRVDPDLDVGVVQRLAEVQRYPQHRNRRRQRRARAVLLVQTLLTWVGLDRHGADRAQGVAHPIEQRLILQRRAPAVDLDEQLSGVAEQALQAIPSQHVDELAVATVLVRCGGGAVNDPGDVQQREQHRQAAAHVVGDQVAGQLGGHRRPERLCRQRLGQRRRQRLRRELADVDDQIDD